LIAIEKKLYRIYDKFRVRSADANVIVLERSVAERREPADFRLGNDHYLPGLLESPWNSAAPAAADTKKGEQITGFGSWKVSARTRKGF